MSARKQEIARRFGAAAAAYDRSAAVQRLAADRLAQRILDAGLPRAPRVLEIGCGTGDLLAALEPKVGVGIDLSPRLVERGVYLEAYLRPLALTDCSEAMLRDCRERFAARPAPLFAVMDAEAPSLRPGFDLVCGALALQWFEQRAGTLRRLAGLLRPGGLLVLEVAHP